MASRPRWFWFDLRGPVEALDLVVAQLSGTGLTGVEDHDETEVGPRLRVYWPVAAGVEEVREAVRSACAGAGARLAGEGACEREDWMAGWRRHRRPVRASRRVVVVPPERAAEVPPGGVRVVLDQRLAFGSGHHATTRLCLELLEENLRPGLQVVDVGAGTGVLSIAAALLGAGGVTAFESDAEALPELRANLRLNAVSDRVRLVAEPFGDAPPPACGLLVANLLLGELLPILPAAASAAEGGLAILGGIEEEQRGEVAAALAPAGLRLSEERRREGWVALLCAA